MRLLFYVLVFILICNFALYANSDEIVLKPTIYGDREGAECLGDILSYNLAKNSFSQYYKRNDKGIFVHIIGDGLSNQMSKDFYGVELYKLDKKTREKGVIFEKTTIYDQPCLMISAIDINYLAEFYRSNNNLQENIEQTIKAKSNIPVQTDNLVWRSNGYEPKIFRGLFKNPDYSNLSLFLQEDKLTKQTEQVKSVAKIINNNKDISTLKEIYNLLRAFDNDQTPENIFEVSASKILSTPVLGGCTTYATAFSTLCRTKGIPAVVVDSAHVEWILSGCRLNYVRGHFFVEVYIKYKWYLVDSTAGKLYKNYDRNNWLLPDNYIGFTKSLSFIDPGTSEKNHNLLQRVAFVNKKVDYESPNYPVVDLNDRQKRNNMKVLYSRLNLSEDNNLSLSDNVYEIKADSSYIDFSNIN